MSESKITCPNCGHTFSSDEAIARHIEEKLKAEFQEKNREAIAALEKRNSELKKRQDDLENQKKQFQELQEKAREEYVEKLNAEKKKIKEELKRKAEKEAKEEMEEMIKELKEDLDKKKAENKQLQKKEIEFLRKEVELKEAKEKLEIEVQKKLLEGKKQTEEEAMKKASEQWELKEKEYQKQIDDAKKSAAEMKRKMEQGSMQLQGEVQELAIEDQLKQAFPFDRIDEVSKGIRGADCVQTVINQYQQECGKIIFESKRTQNFGGDWIDKLKADMLQAGADVAVLITQTLPKGQTSFTLVNGVWVCSFAEFQSLALALREGLMMVHATKGANENKGDKMQMLYTYLTGVEFRHQVEAIVEGFTSLKDELEREKRAMQRIWKEREKQIEKVIMNTIDLYGSVKGIAGASVKSIESLEMDDRLLGDPDEN